MERHARIKGINSAFVYKMLDRWPLPGCAPTDRYGPRWTLNWILRQDSDHLRELCEKHALKTSGGSTKLIRRFYLHYRSVQLRLGDPIIGYGPGHEAVRTPMCVCGRLLRKDLEASIAEKKKRKGKLEVPKKRFPRLPRFPRN